MRDIKLENVADACLYAAKIVMETGSRARVIAQTASHAAACLGAECVGIRIGYASISITLRHQDKLFSHMITIGKHKVNYRLNEAVRSLVRDMNTNSSIEDFRESLISLEKSTPSYSPFFIAFSVGLACAGFARLLGADWQSFLPVFIGSGLGQMLHALLLRRGLNSCVATSFSAFFMALVGGLGAQLAASTTVNLAIISSILLLVPGVPAINAQMDIIDGHPTLGSARAVSVIMVMAFATTGVWLASTIIGAHL